MEARERMRPERYLVEFFIKGDAVWSGLNAECIDLNQARYLVRQVVPSGVRFEPVAGGQELIHVLWDSQVWIWVGSIFDPIVGGRK